MRQITYHGCPRDEACRPLPRSPLCWQTSLHYLHAIGQAIRSTIGLSAQRLSDYSSALQFSDIRGPDTAFAPSPPRLQGVDVVPLHVLRELVKRLDRLPVLREVLQPEALEVGPGVGVDEDRRTTLQ